MGFVLRARRLFLDWDLREIRRTAWLIAKAEGSSLEQAFGLRSPRPIPAALSKAHTKPRLPYTPRSVLSLLPNSTLQKSSDNRPQKPFNTFRCLSLFCLLHQNPLTVNTVSCKSYITSIRHHHPGFYCIRKLDI